MQERRRGPSKSSRANKRESHDTISKNLVEVVQQRTACRVKAAVFILVVKAFDGRGVETLKVGRSVDAPLNSDPAEGVVDALKDTEE